MKKPISRFYLLLVLVPLLLLASMGGYYFLEETAAGSDVVVVPQTPAPPSATPVPVPTPEPTPTPFPEHDITLMAVGDNLMHLGIVASGKQEDGTYDFSMLFQGISPFLNAADIRIINQETVMGGNSRGFSGFPYFNSPTEVGDAIADAGFNVVLQASNHTADQKLDGLLYCADFWKNKHPEVLVTGIHEDASQADDIPLLTIDDVTFAILNYTYGANTETLPLDLLGHLNLLCAVNEKNGQMDFTTLNPQVLEDISRAKELADIVIVCPHWGTEYSSKISSYQEKWALEMTEAGADVIIGTHPHVVEPVEWITAENGNESLCYYSLGNYVSTQKNALSMLEGMAWLTFHVAEDGVSIERKTTGCGSRWSVSTPPDRYGLKMSICWKNIPKSWRPPTASAIMPVWSFIWKTCKNGATRFSVISYSPKIRRSIISKPILLINNVSHTDDGTVVHSTDNDTFP